MLKRVGSDTRPPRNSHFYTRHLPDENASQQGPLSLLVLVGGETMTWRNSSENGALLEDVAIVVGLVAIQFVYAGSSILSGYLMSLGIDTSTLVAFPALATFFVLTPVAAYFERSSWPDKIGLKLGIQLIVIALGGVTLFQTLLLKGIMFTSPAIATAMSNLAPGLIFVIAWTVRLEKVDIGCLYSKVKIIGTLFCVVGAIAMSLMHSTSAKEGKVTLLALETIFDQDKITGCLYLMAAVFCLSSSVVLQAKVLADFPAPMSLCAVTSLMGAFTTVAVELMEKHRIEFIGPFANLGNLVGYSVAAGIVSGTCVSFSGWAMKKRGPVLVSMFNPIATVCSIVISYITLGDTFHLGSLAGMLLMFAGLYFVLWAKGKENDNENRSEFNAEKPLLS
ncbi:hypothetical protein MLD38_015468 [Melastoma candidum]|uniref:Uncharacterized protein n=1 Tax=Melastoma candidum TaxID=119954 RepID=A0ACB9RHJ5_9MYRT|nr:hypothetical protein MLD38_015468 [Melastoma candidum]